MLDTAFVKRSIEALHSAIRDAQELKAHTQCKATQRLCNQTIRDARQAIARGEVALMKHAVGRRR